MEMTIKKLFLSLLIILLEINSFSLAPNVAFAIPNEIPSNISSSTASNTTVIKSGMKTDLKDSSKSVTTESQDGVFYLQPAHDRNFANSSEEQRLLELKNRERDHTSTSELPGAQPKFDDKAVERALIVSAFLAAILLIYFGLKFVLLKKRKVNKRYGRIESEIDLLDEIDDADTEEEDDTLFDINSTSRSQF